MEFLFTEVVFDTNRPQDTETKSQQDAAAAKLQATWRGNRVRDRMGVIKPGLPGRPRGLVKNPSSKILGKELASKLPGVQKRTQSAEDMRVLMLQAQLDKLRTLPPTPSGPSPRALALTPPRSASRPHTHPGTELRWRPKWERQLRLAIAWGFNFFIVLFSCLVSLIYALKYREEATKSMMMSWLIAYGVTFAIVEPMQVIVLACAPCLFDEETRFGRFMSWLRYIYNELCSP